jgi:cell division protein FtsB
MNSVALLSFPGLLIGLVLAAIAAWIGHTIGRNNEGQRKQLALAEAEESSKAALLSLSEENKKKIDVLNKANSNEMDGLKQAHAAQIDQINTAHQKLVDSLKSSHSDEITRLESGHSALIEKMNASNNANINELEQRRQKELEGVRNEHAEALREMQGENNRRLHELEKRHAEDKAGLKQQLAELRVEREKLTEKSAQLERDLTSLRDEMKEAKLNNMFSVSKSGEKLIRVVRSVQELASELDDTSRTVTGGDYSFFDQIKDQRDRETVLSLTAGRATYSSDTGDSDGEVDDSATSYEGDDETGRETE